MEPTQDTIKLSLKGHGAALKDLWRNMSDTEKNTLRNSLTIKKIQRGEYIYHVNDKPTHMICLSKGRVKVVKEGVIGGRAQIVRLLKPVELFAYRAFFAGEKHCTAAIAVDDCEIIMFPIEDVLNIIKSNNDVVLFLLRQLSEELGNSDQRNISMTQKHIRGRLAEAILTLEERCGLLANGIIDIKLNREEIASMSNMTTSNAIRTLSAFAKEGIIELRGKNIVITNHKQLEKISRLG